MPLRALLTCVSLLFSLSIPADEVVRVGGTGSGGALIEKLADLYRTRHPGARIQVLTPALGSSGGLRALAAGHIDLAVSGRAPKPDEGSFASFEYARTPLVFASRENRQPQGFTLRELLDIYAGRRTNWGDGSPIRLILRAPFESDTVLLQSLSPEMRSAIDSAQRRMTGLVGENDLDTIKLLAELPGAFGPTTLGLVRTSGISLAIIPVDGQTPGLKAVEQGSYPLTKRLFLVTRVPAAAATKDFIDFLRSSAARDYLRQNEYLPEFR